MTSSSVATCNFLQVTDALDWDTLIHGERRACKCRQCDIEKWGKGMRNMSGCYRWRPLHSLLVGCTVLLSATASGAGPSGIREINSVHIEGGDFVSVEPTVPFDNPDGCGSSTRAFFMASAPGYREKLSLALSAQATGQKINGWLNGCVNTPWGYSVPALFSIAVTR